MRPLVLVSIMLSSQSSSLSLFSSSNDSRHLLRKKILDLYIQLSSKSAGTMLSCILMLGNKTPHAKLFLFNINTPGSVPKLKYEISFENNKSKPFGWSKLFYMKGFTNI